MPLLRRTAAALALCTALASPAFARRMVLPPRGTSSELQTSSQPVVEPKLTYCGGRVVSQATLVAVLWGTPDVPSGSPSCSGTMSGCLTQYFNALVASPEFGWLDHDYQTTIPGADGNQTNQHLATPTFYGAVQITPTNTAATVGESAVESELVSQIQAGHLPAPVTDPDFPGSTMTIYEVFFPLTVNPSDPGNEACGEFCGYHDSWHSNVEGKDMIIAIIPSGMPPGYSTGDCSRCGEKSDWFANLGGTISHETTEAMTDPDVGMAGFGCSAPLGWYDGSGEDAMSHHAEIGDICEGIPDTSGGQQITEVTLQDANGKAYTVQREWSNSYSACMVGLPEAFSLGQPDAVLLGDGGRATTTLTTSATQGGGAATLTFSAHGLPTGVSATFDPPMVTAGQSTTVTVALQTGATQTGGTFGIVAESGPTQAQTTLDFSAPDFTATLSGSTITLTAGGAPATLTLDTSITSGPARDFTATVANLPGVTLTPSSTSLGGTSTLSFQAAAGAPSAHGTYQLTLSSAGVAHVMPLVVTLTGDDVSMTVPAMLSVAQGGSVSFPLTTKVASGNAQSIALSVPDLPTGATATFSPATVMSGETSTVTLTLPATEPLGQLAFHIQAQGTVKAFTATAELEVVAPSGCNAGLTPGWLALLGLAALGMRRRARAV